MREPVTTVHENRVIAEPSQVLVAAIRGDAPWLSGGRPRSALHGDVQDIVDLMTATPARTRTGHSASSGSVR